VQILSVFLDTLLVCTATAFMCLCSGVEPTKAISGAPYVQQSLKVVLGDFGPIFITVAMILFAFTTLLGNLYYVDQSLYFMMNRKPGRKVLYVYYIIASLIIFVGAGLSADLLWGIADITMGAMALINIPVILFLGKYALRALKDYEKKVKNGEELTFKAEDVGLPHNVDCWK
jgi:AGCS family alanine or glycine:cation symporter